MTMSPEENMIALVRKVRDQLEFYGDQHLAKTPPQAEKAKANYDLVAEINNALLALAAQPTLVLTPDDVVRDPDVFRPGAVAFQPIGAMIISSIPHLTKFVETLAGRDEEDYAAVSMRIGDLRVLAGVDGG
jgi:hypothetical protein